MNAAKPAQLSRMIVIYEESVDLKGVVTRTPLRVISPDEHIDLREAARISGLSVRHLSHLCDTGILKTAHKPGNGPKAHWRIARSEILRRLQPPAE